MFSDRLLPGWFSKTDRHGTPQRVTWIAGIASALLAGVFPIKAVADPTNIGILAVLVVACFPAIIFRDKRSDAPGSPISFQACGPRIRHAGLKGS